jgi:hypothetical protein
MSDQMWPGDEVHGQDGETFTLSRQVAYRGNPDCTYLGCTRDGRKPLGEPGCYGWHCSLCDAPCSMMGHDCPRAGDVEAVNAH